MKSLRILLLLCAFSSSIAKRWESNRPFPRQQLDADDEDPSVTLFRLCSIGEDDEPHHVMDHIEAGADIHYRDPESGLTCLLAAVREGKLDAIRTLIKLGADTDAEDPDGVSMARLASRYGRPQILAVLKDTIGSQVLQDPQVLMEACGGMQVRYVSTIQFLLSNAKWSESELRTCRHVARTDMMRAQLDEHRKANQQTVVEL